MHEANCNSPALRTCSGRLWAQDDVIHLEHEGLAAGASHSKLTKAFPHLLPWKPAKRRASLSCFISSVRATVDNSWPLVEMLRPINCWRSLMHLSVTSKGHQERGQEGPAAHMLTQRVDQIRCLVNRLGAVVSALGLNTTLQRAQERRPNH